MQIVKKIVAVLVLFVFVVVLAAAALLIFVDPNKLKPVIIAEIKQQFGYQASIEGNLSWSFFPRLGVQVDHMTLTAADQKTPFLDLKKLTIAASVSQLLRGKNLLEGDVRVGTLTLMNMQATDAHMGVHWEKNTLTMQPLTADIYHGTCSGSAHGRSFDAQPIWDWSIECNHVALEPMLRAMMGGQSKIKVIGDAQVEFKGMTQGKGRDQMLRQMNGVNTFNVTKGALEGLDLNYFVQAAGAVLTRQPVPLPTTENNRTPFDTLTATAVVKNGVASIDNLLLVSTEFAAKGHGVVDLVTQRIDYDLEVTPLASQKIRWMIPIQISGDLQSPSIHLDTLKLNTLLANEEFEKVKHKVKEEVKKLPAKADKLIKHLLGN